MSLSILLVHEMGIIGANQLDAILMSQFYHDLVGFLLQGESLTIGPDAGVFHLMALQFQVIVVAKHTMIPLNGFTCSGNIAFQYLMGNLTGNTGRADYQTLMIFL